MWYGKSVIDIKPRRKTAMQRIAEARQREMVDLPCPVDLIDAWAQPTRKMLSRCSHVDLVEIIEKEANSRTGEMAASILRHREFWRGPLGLLVVVLCAFLLTLSLVYKVC